MAAKIVTHRRNNAPIIVDVGGGYGGDITLRLKENGIAYQAFNGASASKMTTADGVRFVNARSEAWWRLREELNPDREGGSVIALPDDAELLADLAAPTFEVRTNGIQIESKDTIRKRLGRSPDKGDAVVMCLAPGNKAIRRRLNGGFGNKPNVILGYQAAKQRRQ
jgi:hypothetical protein